MTKGQITFGATSSTSFDVLDGQHVVLVGTFISTAVETVLVYSATDGTWQVGTATNNQIGFTEAAANNFGNLADPSHLVWRGKFSGTGDEILFYYYDAQQDSRAWWHGVLGNNPPFSLVATTAFGNLIDGQHLVSVGDFSGSQSSILFTSAADGTWCQGTLRVVSSPSPPWAQ